MIESISVCDDSKFKKALISASVIRVLLPSAAVLGLTEALTEEDGEIEAEGESEIDGLSLFEVLFDALLLADLDALGLGEIDPDGEAEPDGEALAEPDATSTAGIKVKIAIVEVPTLT